MSFANRSTTFDLDDLLSDRDIRVIVCCGSGGVGKTTTAASLAIKAAQRGRRVCLITIDPARRLAQLLGVTELTNTPTPVSLAQLPEGAQLQAMMLDMKGTFDDLVRSAVDERTAQQILENPFYVSLSTSFSGTQEYMAMEKLAQLEQAAQFDLIVVDTPPSRSTMDFLDAPKRLGTFLNGSFIKILTAPARIGGRVIAKALNAGAGAASGVLDKILGADFLRDISDFITNFDEVFGGFQARAERTYALLQNPSTRFVLVTTASPEAMREADAFLARLKADQMSTAGLVINRIERALDHDLPKLPAVQAEVERNLTEKLLNWAQQSQQIQKDQIDLVDGFTQSHPLVPVLLVPTIDSNSPLLFDLESA